MCLSEQGLEFRTSSFILFLRSLCFPASVWLEPKECSLSSNTTMLKCLITPIIHFSLSLLMVWLTVSALWVDTSDSAAKSTAGFTQISDGVISRCHLLETSTRSPSDKDSWNVAWSHWANPGACQHLWGCWGSVVRPQVLCWLDFLQIFPSHWDPKVPLLNKPLWASARQTWASASPRASSYHQHDLRGPLKAAAF